MKALVFMMFGLFLGQSAAAASFEQLLCQSAFGRYTIEIKNYRDDPHVALRFHAPTIAGGQFAGDIAVFANPDRMILKPKGQTSLPGLYYERIGSAFEGMQIELPGMATDAPPVFALPRLIEGATSAVEIYEFSPLTGAIGKQGEFPVPGRLQDARAVDWDALPARGDRVQPVSMITLLTKIDQDTMRVLTYRFDFAADGRRIAYTEVAARNFQTAAARLVWLRFWQENQGRVTLQARIGLIDDAHTTLHIFDPVAARWESSITLEQPAPEIP